MANRHLKLTSTGTGRWEGMEEGNMRDQDGCVDDWTKGESNERDIS